MGTPRIPYHRAPNHQLTIIAAKRPAISLAETWHWWGGGFGTFNCHDRQHAKFPCKISSRASFTARSFAKLKGSVWPTSLVGFWDHSLHVSQNFRTKKWIELGMFRNFVCVIIGMLVLDYFCSKDTKKKGHVSIGLRSFLIKTHTTLNQVCIVREFWASNWVLFCYAFCSPLRRHWTLLVGVKGTRSML